MKHSLRDLKLVLVYVYEWVIEGKQHSAVLKPIDAANGVILEETFDGSGIMRGLSVSGGLVHIPLEGITHYFETWWKVSTSDGRGGRQSYYTDDTQRAGEEAARIGDKRRWDAETGESNCIKEVEKPPQDAKRIYHEDKRP